MLTGQEADARLKRAIMDISELHSGGVHLTGFPADPQSPRWAVNLLLLGHVNDSIAELLSMIVDAIEANETPAFRLPATKLRAVLTGIRAILPPAAGDA